MDEKKSEEPNIDYFKDNALSSEKDDEFQHKHYVSVLKDILLKSQTPINIGLYGKWGVGKSSIVHMLDEAIKNEEELKEFEYVEVDAWGISRKSLQQGILEEINAKLGFPYAQEKLEDKLYNVQQIETAELKNIIKNHWWIWFGIASGAILTALFTQEDILSTLSAFGIISIIGVLIPLSKMFFNNSKRIIPKTVSTFQFNKIYEDIIKQRKKKLVVVIDNLDRCEDIVAVELLGIIQTFMVKNNCINILACDDEAIVTHLKNVKRNYTEKDGNEFLSKFFQVTIRIPPFIGENLTRYAERLIKKRSVPFSPFVKSILVSGAIENPRKINQFLNIAVASYRLAEFKENAGKLQKKIITGNTNFLMKVIVIRHEWPEFCKELKISPDLMNDEKRMDVWCRDQISNKIIGNEEISRLRRFLNATKASHTNDIIPFLILNQESYTSETRMGEFEDAFITQDPKAVEIFEGLEDGKQEQYLNKIKELMKKNESEPEKLTLVNCAHSLIGIISKISNNELRTTALATLGEYMSLQLLEHLDKFNIDKLGLFGILEEMIDIFSKPIYTQLISNIFNKDQINEVLLEKFFQYGDIIEMDVLNEIDKKIGDKIHANSYDDMEFIVKCIRDYNWSKNNITKPSNIVKCIIEKINFEQTSKSISNSEIYEKIDKVISDEEKEKYYEQIQIKIDNCMEMKHVLPPKLLKYLQKLPKESFDGASYQKQKIFVSLSNLIADDIDLVQNEKILKIITSWYQKIIMLDDQIISPLEHINKAFVNHVKHSDVNTIVGILSDSSYHEFLDNKEIINVLIKKFQESNSNIPKIIRFLLKIKSHTTEKIVKNMIRERITSRDKSAYEKLLTIAGENNSEYNSNLIQEICEICIEEAENGKNPNRYSMYRHAMELDSKNFQSMKISNYAIGLIKDVSPSVQDQGFKLLKKFNMKHKDKEKLKGIEEAIDVSTSLLEANSDRIAQYLEFIFKYKDQFDYQIINKITELFKKSLSSNASENIMNNIMQYIRQISVKNANDIVDELVDFAKKTRYANAKEQSKRFFIENKDQFQDEHIESIEKIFGKDIFKRIQL